MTKDEMVKQMTDAVETFCKGMAPDFKVEASMMQKTADGGFALKKEHAEALEKAKEVSDEQRKAVEKAAVDMLSAVGVEVEEAVLVNGDEDPGDGVDKEEKTDLEKAVAPLTKAVGELKATVATLSKENADLRKRIPAVDRNGQPLQEMAKEEREAGEPKAESGMMEKALEAKAILSKEVTDLAEMIRSGKATDVQKSDAKKKADQLGDLQVDLIAGAKKHGLIKA